MRSSAQRLTDSLVEVGRDPGAGVGRISTGTEVGVVPTVRSRGALCRTALLICPQRTQVSFLKLP